LKDKNSFYEGATKFFEKLLIKSRELGDIVPLWQNSDSPIRVRGQIEIEMNTNR